jgi:hypothetical protein
MPDVEAIRQHLLATDDAFRGLSDEHHEFESRLTQLSLRSHLSEPEQLEEATLKKKKLRLKDRMEAIIQRHRTETAKVD